MTTLPQSTQNQLRQHIEVLERLEEQKREIADEIKERFALAKGQGFDVKIMRQVLRMRKKSQTERQEEDAVLTAYLHGLGMLAEELGPLGQSAFEREISPSQISKGRPKIAGDGYLDKVKTAYEAAMKRNATVMMMPDGVNAFTVDVVASTLREYGAIA